MKVEIELPPTATIGDVTQAIGGIFKAAAEWVDWEELHNDERYVGDAIEPPGRILFDIARQLQRAT